MPKTNPCSNCGVAVAARRPSPSGNHYCSKPKCQTAKQRFYRGRTGEERAASVRELSLELVGALVEGRRTSCGQCGLEDAIPGLVHRSTDPGRPCFGVGQPGRDIIHLLDVVHPERAPR